MANADGSVIIRADIDDKQAQKELNALTKKSMHYRKSLIAKKQKEIRSQPTLIILAHSWTRQKPSWIR